MASRRGSRFFSEVWGLNYYRRYPGDYGRDTSHLSLAEHGAYNILLDHVYTTEKPLPESLDAIYRICRAMTAVDRAVVRSVVQQFFPLNGHGRLNPRAARQIKDERKRIDEAREKAEKAAKARWSHA